MGRKSTRPDKSAYQLAREEVGLTREQASEKLDFITERRIERIEYGSLPLPEEVVAMADAYNQPELRNYYCSHECEIGRRYVPEIKNADNLSAIILEMLASLNTLNRSRDRLIDITSDGVISEEEREDFDRIREKLDEMSQTIDALKLWLDKK